MSFFIRQLSRDPLEAYTDESRRSGSCSGGTGNHTTGPSSSYRLDIDFDAGGPSFTDVRGTGQFDDASDFLNHIDFI